MRAYNQVSFKSAKKPRRPDWEPREFARAILLAAQKNQDHRASYTELWEQLHGRPPHYRSFFKKFSQPFAELGLACMALGLPYIGAMVVAKGNRRPSEAAVKNMAKFIEDQGITTGRNAREYLEEQAKLAAKLTLQDLDGGFG